MERPAAADLLDATVQNISNGCIFAAASRFSLPFALYVGPVLRVFAQRSDIEATLRNHLEIMRGLGTPQAETRILGHSILKSGRAQVRAELRWHAGDPRIFHGLRLKVFVIGQGCESRIEMIEIDPRHAPAAVLDCLAPDGTFGSKRRMPLRAN